MTNLYPGLARGPIDHNASSVINVIANEALNMGDAVALVAAPATELLPRVDQTDAQGEECYGIVVGGDTDGIYGTGAIAADDTTRAAAAAGDGVVVVTRGRCLARVKGDGTAIAVGTKLTPAGAAAVIGQLEPAAAGDLVVATALQATTGALDIIAVDVDPIGVL
jgi:uncharacterized membrane protein